MTALAQQHCEIDGGAQGPLSREAADRWLAELGGDWSITASGQLEKTYTFDGFRPALAFVVECGVIAEVEQHHPDLGLRYGAVTASISTHAVQGLTLSDFILAAKLDAAHAAGRS